MPFTVRRFLLNISLTPAQNQIDIPYLIGLDIFHILPQL